MKPATRPEARVLATMARGGTLIRKASTTRHPHRYPWELRDRGGGIITFPAGNRRICKRHEGECWVWWAKKLAPLVERGLLVADHPVFEKATRLYITDEGQALAWTIVRDGGYGIPIPCLLCGAEPHGAAGHDHEYAPALMWAKRLT